MNAKLVSKENNTANFTFEVGAEKFEEGMKYSYNKNKNQIQLPGFRKGKAPRKLIEAEYGESVFYDDAINFVLPDAYDEAITELNLDVVSKPTIDISSVSSKEGVSFKISVTVKPVVILGQYKGLEYERIDVSVSDADVDAELKMVQDKNARTVSVERAAQEGDIVNLSYAGTIDGVAFEGGTADSYDLTLGSHSFIDTFEDQIAGHNVGDKFDVNVAFPEEYHEKSLAGKPAVFAVEIKEISVKELPEINDEFAQDVSEFDTLAEYKADIMAKIKKAKEANAKTEQSDELIDKLALNATIDVPDVMIDDKVDQMIEDVKQNFARQGIPMEAYMNYMNSTMDQLKGMYRLQAEKMVRAKLALGQIAVEEKLEAADEEVEKSIKEIATAYGIEAENMMNMVSDAEKKGIREEILVQKAIDFVMANAVEVEPKKMPEFKAADAKDDEIKIEKVEK